ncbi:MULTISPECIES: carboxy-S-adenosyl-L-methionine synthase CmoA [unclassified Rhizobium]|uniref:carboxy-S-adenosyl-L-methionine synthase CmoA n=1 Tax=unclassified Rhizobium TaxID=2613769 RepID=UPI0003603605|nr:MULTISPECIES: carboxy-S-adenosyl-L-methionine synthase CmoA [unclassified Rhizobium]MBD9447375.1 carboxy-S-adenosyl-L-methionine synthase CmoA [Rhizobium sp. RHZ01]
MTDPSNRLVLHTNSRDEVFADERDSVADFSFNSTVANVFDDMVSRSVPFYGEMQRMVCELARDFAQPQSNLYDIGCSTATTLLALDHVVDNHVDFVGIDNAPEMLKKAAEKIEDSGTNRSIELVTGDLHRGFSVENASVVTMLLTLQFVRPLFRERVMKTIYDGLNEHGCLLLIEKLTSEDTTFNRLFIDHYYDFKRRNGYSSIEISKKREALENVLIPYRLEENTQLLKEVGFKSTEVFFRWYNFCGIVAVK